MTGDQSNSAAGLLTGRVWAVFVMVVLPLATCGVVLDAHKVLWYAVFPYRYYIEIKTDLTVDGEAVEVTGVAECKWVARLKPIITPHIIGSGWDRRGGILAKRLPSDRAVIILVDPPCRARGDPASFAPPKNFWKTTQLLPAPVGQLPVQTLLLDDASEPTRIERSFSKAYFADPRSRVHYIRGTYLPKRRAQRADSRDEVPWLRVKGKPTRWTGSFARVTKRAVWNKEPAVAASLKPLTEPTKLTGERQLPTQQGFHLTDGIVRSLYLKDGYWDYRPHGPEPDGMVALYPREFPIWKGNTPANHDDLAFLKEARLSVNGQLTNVNPSIYVAPIYEPGSAVLLSIDYDGVSVSADEVRFNRGSNTLSGRLFRF